MINLKNKWMNDPKVLAQIGHVLGGYAAVLTARYVSGGELAAVIVAGLVVAYAAVKEFWYDKNYEIPVQTDADDVLDFSMYCVGTIIGLGVSIFL